MTFDNLFAIFSDFYRRDNFFNFCARLLSYYSIMVSNSQHDLDYVHMIAFPASRISRVGCVLVYVCILFFLHYFNYNNSPNRRSKVYGIVICVNYSSKNDALNEP